MGSSPAAATGAEQWHEVVTWTGRRRHLNFVHSTPRPGQRPSMFIHGWGLTPQSYLQPMAAMTEWATIYAPSLPGFGPSTKMAHLADNTLDGYADAVVDGWQAGALPEPMPLVAHSMGSGVSVRIAQRHPEMVTSLVLVCPIGGAGNHPLSWLQLAASVAHEMHVSFLPRVADAAPFLVRNIGGAVRAAYAAKTANLRTDIDRLVADGVPVTLVVADDDKIVPPGPLKGSSARIVPVSGMHGWLLRRPQEFADTIHPYVFAQGRKGGCGGYIEPAK